MSKRNRIRVEVYSGTARAMHWIMAALLLFQLAAGLVMAYDAPRPNVASWLVDTFALYDVHKLLGVVLLGLVAVRLMVRVKSGAPADEPSLEPWQRESSHMVHGWLYLLMFGVPILGWLAVSLYPALVVFGSLPLPGLAEPDRDLSKGVFLAHALAAYVMIALVAVHVGAALYHHFVRRDGVLRRMLPGLDTRD